MENKISYGEIITMIKTDIEDMRLVLSLFAYQKDSMLENPSNKTRALFATQQIIKDMEQVKSILESIEEV